MKFRGQTRDEIIEEIALAIEQESLLDLAGIAAKRKRGREDAQLRMRAREEHRKELGLFIRSFKSDKCNDPMIILERIAEHKDSDYACHLVDAWPLAWKGWLTIECIIQCDSNCLPPPVRFQIKMTDKGRDVLATVIKERVAGKGRP